MKGKNTERKNVCCCCCIPEGTFEVDKNCTNCRHADYGDVDKYGRVYCRGGYGGYNHPRDRQGCFHFVAR